jgi:hypothetical protein
VRLDGYHCHQTALALALAVADVSFYWTAFCPFVQTVVGATVGVDDWTTTPSFSS